MESSFSIPWYDELVNLISTMTTSDPFEEEKIPHLPKEELIVSLVFLSKL